MKPVESFSNKSQINDLTSQVKSLKSQLRKMQTKLVPIPERTLYSHEREHGLKEKYADYRDNILADYIYGLYHPDIVFKEGLEIKSPSYMPIPTTSFKFKETFTITPNSQGNFLVFWNPNFLGTEKDLAIIHGPNGYDTSYNVYFSNVYVNRDSLLDGNTMLTNGWEGMCFRHVLQDFEKYRLTSACIKVKYTGKVLDQSGMFAAAASYVSAPRVVRGVPVSGGPIPRFPLRSEICESLAQFGDFDNIRQGQWATTTSVVTDPDGITCVYVPTDPLNQVFVNNATTIDALNHRIDYENTGYISSWFTTNANISYAIAGYGVTPSTSCITVETYYNFEIIVKQEQYPYFSPRSLHTKFIEHKDDIAKITNSAMATGLVSRTKVHDNPSVWSKVRSAFDTAARISRNVYPYIQPLLKMLV